MISRDNLQKFISYCFEDLEFTVSETYNNYSVVIRFYVGKRFGEVILSKHDMYNKDDVYQTLFDNINKKINELSLQNAINEMIYDKA